MSRRTILVAVVLTGALTQLPGAHAGTPAAVVAVPPDRRIDWSLAGIPRGIPVRTTLCATLDARRYGDGSTDATGAIQDALDRCPPGQVVFLPAGTYATSDTIHLRTDMTLRGDGPGRTTIRYEGAATRSVLDMRGTFYWDVYGIGKTYDLPAGAAKDARMLYLGSTEGISVGDVLLLDQRNDGALVDHVGSEGPCTYCSREEGRRARAQIVEVTGVDDTVVSLNLPLFFDFDPALSPQAVLVRSSSMIRRAGVEDLALTQAEPVNDFIVEMDAAQHCWLENIDVSRMKRRGVWHVESLQNEIQGSVFHDAVAGFGRDRGYGVQIDAQSTATLVENNVFYAVDGGGVMTSGGAIGNVVAYNYLADMRFDDPWWLIAGPSINHSAHPSMNLWEGNIGPMIGGDFIHGSSSHQTVFRSRSAGWKEAAATGNNNAVDLQYRNTYMTVMGSVLGTPGQSDTYELAWPAAAPNDLKAIWRLGYGGPNGAGDPNVRATLLRHGNWDSVTGGTVWDPAIAERELPFSLYRRSRPRWWGSLPWPPIGPDLSPMVGKIPAQVRYEALFPQAPTATPVETKWLTPPPGTTSSPTPSPAETGQPTPPPGTTTSPTPSPADTRRPTLPTPTMEPGPDPSATSKSTPASSGSPTPIGVATTPTDRPSAAVTYLPIAGRS